MFGTLHREGRKWALEILFDQVVSIMFMYPYIFYYLLSLGTIKAKCFGLIIAYAFCVCMCYFGSYTVRKGRSFLSTN